MFHKGSVKDCYRGSFKGPFGFEQGPLEGSKHFLLSDLGGFLGTRTLNEDYLDP